MDWQIRIALIIAGIGLIGFIFYDYSRRKKIQNEKQRLIEKMRASAEQLDSQGFDINGVGNVRKSEEEAHASSTDIRELNEVTENTAKVSTNQNVTDQNVIGQSVTNRRETTEITKQSPTEQMHLNDLDEQSKADTNATEITHDLVISLILRALPDQVYQGKDFMPLLLSQGMRHGDMGIFHRHTGNAGKVGKVIYSVANAINPGTIDINNIEAFETPAFAFFMTLPGPVDPLFAFEGMVKTMRLLQQELGGQILDETRSVYTEQTHQHKLDMLQDYITKSSLKQ